MIGSEPRQTRNRTPEAGRREDAELCWKGDGRLGNEMRATVALRVLNTQKISEEAVPRTSIVPDDIYGVSAGWDRE